MNFRHYALQSIFLFLVLYIGLMPMELGAQVFSDEFGKNRVQYHKRFDNWTFYESDHFYTYWYGNGRNVAEVASLLAEKEIANIENIIEYRINNKIDLIVYNDITDLHQSNIGIEETVNTTKNRFKTLDNKVFVYNSGNPEDLRRQIREGIASILVNYTLYGENLKEIVKNSLFEDLPIWFKPGLIAYCGEPWSVDLDNSLKAFFLSNRDNQFSELVESNSELSGHSFWYFIHSVYGKNVIANILYLIRINGDIDVAFKYVLGENFALVTQRWQEFYRIQYLENKTYDDLSQYKLNFKVRKKERVLSGNWSPSGETLAFITTEFGKKRVYLYRQGEKKPKRIFKNGFINKLQISDDKYPLIDWSKDGSQLLVIYEKTDQIYHRSYSITDQKFSAQKKFAPQIERVISIDHIANEEIVLSGIQRGNTDLYYFNTKSGQLRTITKDFFFEDHLRVGELRGERGIFFSTNRNNPYLESRRIDSLLPLQGLNSYFYSFNSKIYTPLSNEKLNHSIPIMALDSFTTLVLNDQNGVNNLYSSKIQKYISHYRDSISYKNGSSDIIEPAVSNSYDTTKVKTVNREYIYRWKGYTKALTNLDFNIKSLHSANEMFYLSIDEGHQINFFVIPEPILLGTNRNNNKSYYIENIKKIAKRDKRKIKDRATIKAKLKSSNKPNTDNITKEKPTNGFYFQSKFDKKDKAKSAEEEKKESSNTVENEDKLVNSPPVIDSLITEANDTIPELISPDLSHQEFYTHLLLNHEDSVSSDLRVPEDIRFKTSKVIPYLLKFKIDEFKSDLENEPLINGMETFLGDRDNNFSNPLSITFRAKAKDLLEDYVIAGALRFPTSLDGIEYYIAFENKKRQLDKKYIFYRRSNNETVSRNGVIFEKNRLITNNLIYQLKYPLNIFGSLRLTNYFRLDNFVTRALEINTLGRNSVQEQRLGARLEYVYDNTYDIDLNLRGGLRYRVFVEGIKKMNLDYVGDFSYKGSQGINTIFGADIRWYKPVLKHSIVAIRGVSAISQGREKVLFYLGGSRNWLIPQFDNSIPLPQDNFSFYSLATNIRGFKYNSRNGTSYALANFEFRVPLFKYLSRKRIKSDFFRSMQFIAFYDVGKTWNGWNPYDGSQAQSNITISNNEYVELNVAFYRDQVLMSYGWGVRANVFGYYLRLDQGQGIESGQLLKERIWHLSMGTDF